MMLLTVHIGIASAKWRRAFPKMRLKIEQAAALAFLRAKKPRAFKGGRFEINILLSTDAAIRKLNRDFRGMDKPTNVLSFPQSSKIPGKNTPVMLGDVIIAYETLKRECREQDKNLENHTLHMAVHGVLHLLGYDHMRLKDAKNMETLESDILETLGYPDPYHDRPAQRKRSS